MPLPDFQPITWIPCHQSAPREGKQEVTLLTYNGERMIADGNLTGDRWQVRQHDGKRWFDPAEYSMRVIAWRPMPGNEPYQGAIK